MTIRKLRSARVNTVTASQYIGQAGDIFWDESTGTLRISDGHTPGGYYPNVAASIATFGDFQAITNTLSTVNNNEDINLVAQGTGALHFYGGGGLQIHSDGLNSPMVLSVNSAGSVTVFSPIVPAGSEGAFAINGATNGAFQAITNAGTMFHITGNDGGVSTRVAIDNFNGGSQAAYPHLFMRAARGTAATPTVTQAGDTIGRWTAGGYQQSGFVSSPNAVSYIAFNALENFSPSASGSQIVFKTVPHGTNTNTTPLTVDSGNVTVNANLVTNNPVNFIGPTNFYGVITSYGNRISNGDSTFNGNVTVGQGLIVIGDTTHTGNLDINGNLNVAGNAVITSELIFTGAGEMKFNDGTIQTSAALGGIDNLDHITGAFSVIGTSRHLTLSSDATPTNIAGTIVSRDGSGNIAVGKVTATNINTTSVTGNAQIAGSMFIAGNLLVNGTTTSVNSAAISIGTKTLTVSNAAATSSQADGSAFLVGNGGEFADLTFDSVQNAWRSNVSIVPAVAGVGTIGTDTRHWNTVYTNVCNVDTQLQVGANPFAYIGDSLGQFTGNTNSWSMVTNQNLNSGNNASSDFVAIADNGNDVSNYIDMGINSSQYVQAAYSIMKPIDGYLFTNGGNLTIGTQSTQKAIVFFTGGTTADKEAGRITGAGQRWLVGTPVDDGVNKLQVSDGMRVVGNVTAGNVNATNLTNTFTSLQNQITGANAAIVTANTAMKSYVDAVTTAWTANAATQQGLISTNTTNITTLQGQVYTNANVAAYLPTYTGNIAGGNITVTGNVVSGSRYTTGNAYSANMIATGNMSAGGTTIGNNIIYSTNLTTDFNIGQTSATANIVINRPAVHVKDAYFQSNIRVVNNNATGSAFNKTGGTVTANGTTGRLTSNADSIAKSGAATFTVNNTFVGATDVVIVNIASGGTTNSYGVSVTAVAAGSFQVTVINSGTGALAEALTFNFTVIKTT